MNYLMVDISGRSPIYDIALCNALHKAMSPKHHIKLFAANIQPTEIECDWGKMFNFIPPKLQRSKATPLRAIKAIMAVLNYLALIVRMTMQKTDILHFQWLPFVEISSIEKYFLIILHRILPNTKFILTIHNVYPHDSNSIKKQSYRKRFAQVESFFDKFIVHLETTKKEFCSDFKISTDRVKVINHGILTPKNINAIRRHREKKTNLIMFGNQSCYKGTDIFVQAIALLPQECQKNVHALIVGKTYPSYLNELKRTNENIEIIPEYVSDEELYKHIISSDIIILPYREISQSGVLLLALSFKRLIITSDIPSFKETLAYLGEDTFFENGNAESLSKLIGKYVNRLVDEDKQLNAIERLKEKYSWENVAKMYEDFLISKTEQSHPQI